VTVGDTIWEFDSNRRVYPKDKSIGSGPIWREHWVALPITGETSRSWIVGHGWPKKVPKKGPHRGYAFSQAEIDDLEYVHDKCWRIAKQVERCDDANVLRKIEQLLAAPSAATQE
jgi:hypothetical protein